MKIFMVGGTGFFGQYLCQLLPRQGHELTILARPETSRDSFGPNTSIVKGDPTQAGEWQNSLAGHDAVINLAGTSVFQRWTTETKKAILKSRVSSTRNIVEGLRASQGNQVHLLNASCIGYYGSCGDDIIDEHNPPGDTFLTAVAESWEATAQQAEEAGARVVLCRFGIVLGKNGGSFRNMLPLFRSRLGAVWGKGEQWFSWIHEKDAAAIICFLLEHKEIKGPINLTSPNPIRNREMWETMNGLLQTKPLVGALPKWVFKLALGEFSEVFLEGQRVLPDVLIQKGLPFQFRTFKEAAQDLIKLQDN